MQLEKSNFDKNKNYSLSRKIKNGIIITALVVGIPGFMIYNSKKNKNKVISNYDYYDNSITSENFEEPVIENPISVNVSDVNKNNIIFNSIGASNNFLEPIYSKLQEDGIEFSITKDYKNIDVENSLVITLDTDYMVGTGMRIIAPYNNYVTRDGSANRPDALALAMDAAFNEKGFENDGIACGIISHNSSNNTFGRVPSETEDTIKYDDVTYTTIAFGNTNINSDLVVSAIENGLARYTSYNMYPSTDEDLIYRDTQGNVVLCDGIEYIRQFDYNVPIKLGNIEKSLKLK